MIQNPTTIVTGSTAGLGTLLAEILIRQNHNLILINRNQKKSEAEKEKLRKLNPKATIELVEANLAHQPSVEQAARHIANNYAHINALFNNAGILLGSKILSPQGIEMHAQVNTLAPYLLMKLLREPLAAGNGMVLNVSSGAIFMTGGLQLDELKNPHTFRKLVGPYGQSKLALNAFTNGLAADFERDGILVRTMSPGPNKTGMTAGSGMPLMMRIFRPFIFKSPTEGAREIHDAAFDPRFGRQTGIFISANQIKAQPADALNPEMQRRVLEWCRDCTGV